MFYATERYMVELERHEAEADAAQARFEAAMKDLLLDEDTFIRFLQYSKGEDWFSRVLMNSVRLMESWNFPSNLMSINVVLEEYVKYVEEIVREEG